MAWLTEITLATISVGTLAMPVMKFAMAPKKIWAPALTGPLGSR